MFYIAQGDDLNHILISKYLVNISHFEMLLSYAYSLCVNSKTVFLYVTFSDKVWNKSILDFDQFEKYDLPDNLKILSHETDIDRLSYPVMICNFGAIGIRNWLDSKKYKNFHKFIQFDEGSGSWQNFWVQIFIGVQEQKSKNRSIVWYMMKRLISKLISILQFSRIEKWRWLRGGKPNEKIIKYLPKVYASKKPCEELEYFKGETWIILTSPFTELGFVEPGEYLTWIRELIKMIKSGNRNIIIMLKCHPAEDISKYNILDQEISVIKGTESIDSMIWENKYHHYKIVGEYSTALVTLNILYGIETYSVQSLVYRPITGDFKKMFDKYVKSLK